MTGHFLLIVICMAGAAFFAGIETGVISINRLRLKHRAEQGARWAMILDEFREQHDRLLGTTLVGVNICMVAASIEAAFIGHRLLGQWGEAIAGITMTILILVLCEYIPKAWFQGEPMERCRPFAQPLRLAYLVLRPITAAVNIVTSLFIPETREVKTGRKAIVTKDELDLLASESAEHGQLSPRQRIMIHRVVELSARTVREIMVPRDRIVAVESTSTAFAFLKKARETKSSRMPIFDSATGKYVGVLNLYDVLAAPSEQYTHDVARFARAPTFIPETTPVTEVFPRLRVARQPLCLVVNAQNEVTGLITTEDVIQCVVGSL